MFRALVVGCIALSAVSAFAQTAQRSAPPPAGFDNIQPMTPHTRQACSEEIGKFCSDVMPARAAWCLKGHDADLSDNCRKALAKLPKPKAPDNSGDD